MGAQTGALQCHTTKINVGTGAPNSSNAGNIGDLWLETDTALGPYICISSNPVTWTVIGSGGGGGGGTVTAGVRAQNKNIVCAANTDTVIVAAQTLNLGISGGGGWRIVVEGEVTFPNSDGANSNVALTGTTTGSSSIQSFALGSGSSTGFFMNAVAEGENSNTGTGSSQGNVQVRARYEAIFGNATPVTIALHAYANATVSVSGWLSIQAFPD